MTLEITIYDLGTGEILRHIEGYEYDLLMLNVQPGEAVLHGYYEAEDYYVRDGTPHSKPARPDGAYWVFDPTTAQWTDPRSPDEIEAQARAALREAREAAHLPKGELLQRMVMAGIMPAADAVLAARGIIPPSMEAMMAALPSDAQTAAAIKWAADTDISRNHPVIQAAAYVMGLPDEVVDQIFGVTAPQTGDAA